MCVCVCVCLCVARLHAMAWMACCIYIYIWRYAFWKVLCIVTLHSKCSNSLTYENARKEVSSHLSDDADMEWASTQVLAEVWERGKWLVVLMIFQSIASMVLAQFEVCV